MPIPAEEKIVIIYINISSGIQNHRIIRDKPSTTEFKNFKIYPKNAALLFLQIPNSLISEAIKLMCAWSFSIKTSIVCTNTELKESDFTNDVHELILVGVKGTDAVLTPETKINSIISLNKIPEIIYQNIESMYPNGLYYEISNQNNHKGWMPLLLDNDD